MFRAHGPTHGTVSLCFFTLGQVADPNLSRCFHVKPPRILRPEDDFSVLLTALLCQTLLQNLLILSLVLSQGSSFLFTEGSGMCVGM